MNQSALNRSFWSWFDTFLPWLSLGVIAFFTFAQFFLRPYVGIEANLGGQGWVVNNVLPGKGIQAGDVLVRVGTVTGAEARTTLPGGFLKGAAAVRFSEIALERQGQPLVVQYTVPGLTAPELFSRLNSQWFIPYIFWFAGAAALLFLRPRSRLRRLLALFCFLNGAWLSTGGVSGQHLFGSALALRSMVWLAVPVFVQLHWEFPAPLRRLPDWAWAGLYMLCAALAFVSWFQLVPQSLYLVGFVLAIVTSLVLLVVHLITQPAERTALRGMVVALGLILLPMVAIAVLWIGQVQLVYAQVIILGLVGLPGFYFFTLYRRQLGSSQARQSMRLVRAYFLLVTAALLFCLVFALVGKTQGAINMDSNLILVLTLILLVVAMVNFTPFLVLPALADERITLNLGGGSFGFSANRASTGAIFIFLQALAGLTVVVAIQQFNFPGAEPLSVLAAVLTCGLLTLLGYAPFKRFFEHSVLGMPLAPEGLVHAYAGRITTSLEQAALRRLLLEEVLPSLLVREFAQLELRGTALEAAFGLRSEPGNWALPEQAALEHAAGQEVAPGAAGSGLPGWVRLVLPLRAAQETRGYWLLGRRDPDDRYSQEDRLTLQALADQTALALINISQAEALRALYIADVERGESERLAMAAELHDDVLNQLAVLNMNLQEAAPLTLQAYDQAVFHIRQIINGLRPAMLQYGLCTALETLTDELNDRFSAQGGPQIVLELPRTEARYEQRVELALFRIAQQACGNAIQHAQCRTIRISGTVTGDGAELVVSDDGRGFPPGSRIDLPALLAEKHFGLAGMFERAASIGARLQVNSQIGQGSRVELSWKKS